MPPALQWSQKSWCLEFFKLCRSATKERKALFIYNFQQVRLLWWTRQNYHLWFLLCLIQSVWPHISRQYTLLFELTSLFDPQLTTLISFLSVNNILKLQKNLSFVSLFSASNRPWIQRNSTALQVVYIFATLIYYSIFDSQKFFLVKIWLYVTVGLLKPVSNLVANQTKWDYYIQAVWPWFIIDFRQCENYDSTLVVIFMPGTCCLKYETNELQ